MILSEMLQSLCCVYKSQCGF